MLEKLEHSSYGGESAACRLECSDCAHINDVMRRPSLPCPPCTAAATACLQCCRRPRAAFSTPLPAGPPPAQAAIHGWRDDPGRRRGQERRGVPKPGAAGALKTTLSRVWSERGMHRCGARCTSWAQVFRWQTAHGGLGCCGRRARPRCQPAHRGPPRPMRRCKTSRQACAAGSLPAAPLTGTTWCTCATRRSGSGWRSGSRTRRSGRR